jgi:hypothetical protein
MGSFGGMASMTTASVALIAILGAAPVARGTGDGSAINGIFSATSNGEWAQSNEVYHNEATVRSTWTIATTCTSPIDCTGTVKSDQGWTAKIYTTNVQWYVKRDLIDWERCADGTTATGHQVYRFVAVGADDYLDPKSTTYAGVDETTGPSGACGRNESLQIALPFKLVKIG